MSIAQKIKVMVVDDQVTSRLLLTEALQSLGFKSISVAKDGEEAVRALLQDPHHLVSTAERPRLAYGAGGIIRGDWACCPHAANGNIKANGQNSAFMTRTAYLLDLLPISGMFEGFEKEVPGDPAIG